MAASTPASEGHVMQEAARATGHTQCVWHGAWSPTSGGLATCSGDKSVRVWPAKCDDSGKWTLGEAEVLDGFATRTVRSVEWSTCGSYLAAVSFDSSVCLWEREGGEWEPLATLEGHEHEVKSLAWNSGGTLLATCSRDKTVWLWYANPEFDFECAAVLPGHTGDVKFLTWHPSQDTLISASYDGTLRVWEGEGDEWATTATLSAHPSTVWCASFSPDGTRLASCGEEGEVLVWGVDKRGKWSVQATVTGVHSGCAFSLHWYPHGANVLATGGADDSIALLTGEGASWSKVHTQAGAHDGDVNTVRWHPKLPGVLMSGGDDGVVKVWSVDIQALAL